MKKTHYQMTTTLKTSLGRGLRTGNTDVRYTFGSYSFLPYNENIKIKQTLIVRWIHSGIS